MSKNKNLAVLSPVAELPSSDLSEEIVEKQEHLTSQRLKNLVPVFPYDSFKNRPSANLIDLMHWVRNIFSNVSLVGFPIPNPLKNKNNLECFIHNKIVIDGAFLQFCEENNVKVTCLLRDSVASWKTENDSEHFMMQGIYQISTDKFDFLHCALFY